MQWNLMHSSLEGWGVTFASLRQFSDTHFDHAFYISDGHGTLRAVFGLGWICMWRWGGASLGFSLGILVRCCFLLKANHPLAE